ncbi:MAG: acyltransferase [Nocardioides sp.]|uniref:acyltransferase family protein n=1 Tax=Nocardioides sp. TaxID=35761 RepID=UPI0023962F3C|nr:acyltransferase [Nocardioides sp.]MDE0776833.1 acyltransferase [Nocardioides sp.]
MSQQGFHIPSLNGVRAIAVMVVFIGHGYTAPNLWPGHVGVTIFFFLSGFLIVTLLRREREQTGSISMGKFYLRRVLRILPPAYIAIAAAVLIGALGWLEADTTGWGVLAEVLNYTNYYIVIHGREGLPPETSQFWSLGVEEHYYLVIPALLLFMLGRWDRRRVGLALAAVALVIPIYRIALGLAGAGFDRLYVSTDTRIDSLLAGSAMALLANPALGDPLPGGQRIARAMRWLPGVAAVIFVLSALVQARVFRLSIADSIQYACLVPIFWFIITRLDRPMVRVLNQRMVERIGVLSYSIYLFHRLALGLIGRFDLPAPLLDLAALVATVAAAQVVHTLVERPCARLRRRMESQVPARRAS